MSVFSQISHPLPTVKHKDLKVIAANTGKTQKDLINEAIDFLFERYKEYLPKR